MLKMNQKGFSVEALIVAVEHLPVSTKITFVILSLMSTFSV